jgi:hypothetical protein
MMDETLEVCQLARHKAVARSLTESETHSSQNAPQSIEEQCATIGEFEMADTLEE